MVLLMHWHLNRFISRCESHMLLNLQGRPEAPRQWSKCIHRRNNLLKIYYTCTLDHGTFQWKMVLFHFSVDDFQLLAKSSYIWSAMWSRGISLAFSCSMGLWGISLVWMLFQMGIISHYMWKHISREYFRTMAGLIWCWHPFPWIYPEIFSTPLILLLFVSGWQGPYRQAIFRILSTI